MPRAKVQPKQRPITTWEQVPIIMDSVYVAMLLGLTINEVRTMAVRGDLPAIKPGKRAWRFEKTALMKALGIGLVAVPTGIITAGFSEQVSQKRQAEEDEKEFCPYCGKKLK